MTNIEINDRTTSDPNNTLYILEGQIQASDETIEEGGLEYIFDSDLIEQPPLDIAQAHVDTVQAILDAKGLGEKLVNVGLTNCSYMQAEERGYLRPVGVI